MFVSEVQKLVYLAPPRTASTTVLAQLVSEPFNAQTVSGCEHLLNVTTWHIDLDDYTTIISVRHPYTRAISLWRKLCISAILPPVDRLTIFCRTIFAEGLPNFEGFLRHPNLQELLNTYWRCSWHQERVPKFIEHLIHSEKFMIDVENIPKHKGVVFSDKNVGPPMAQAWHSLYEQSPICLELIQKLWLDDFVEFGYSLDFDQCKAGQMFVS